MYAIIETGSKQYTVSKGDIIEVELIDAKKQITFDNILFYAADDKVEIGTPYVKGAKVVAKVLGIGQTKKVTGMKYKNKTKYRRKIGHRQDFTKLQIEEIKHGS